MREESIFYKLTSEDENATTELLCNLCKNIEYKNVILETLGLKDFSIDFNDIETQKSIPNRTKIPDIVIENNEVKVFIENKVDKKYKLNESQIRIYPQNLMNSKKLIKLVYLVPKGYKDIETINKVMEKYNFASLIYWEDLIVKLEEYNKIKKSELINESLIFFNKILKSVPKIKFTMEDLLFMNNVENFRSEINTMAKELELLSNVIMKLKENLGLRFNQNEPNLYLVEDHFGYYFCKECAYIGYSFGWLDSGKSEENEYFLNFSLHKDFVNNDNINAFSKCQYIYEDDWYYFKIDHKIFSNNEREKLLVDYLENIFNEIANI